MNRRYWKKKKRFAISRDKVEELEEKIINTDKEIMEFN